MNLNLPNKVTLSRLGLAVVFFVLVSFDHPACLDWANVVFIIAGLTDILDGYLARKYNLATAFGRVADPLVDKVIVCGGFALLASRTPAIAPWMVVVLISREFLVSSIRGYAESHGTAFSAELAGKAKAVVQMIALAVVIYVKAHGHLPLLPGVASRWVAVDVVYLALVLTVLSAIVYVVKAHRSFTAKRDAPPDAGSDPRARHE